jgi:hypothetical protein
MYAGAWDDRLKAAVPVCSVGNYQAYLGAACCLCEVVPGALQFTEEWGVLALTTPRGLMVVNATKDARQFSVAEAKKSLALVEPVYKLYEKPANLQHAVFESPHDYNQAMREAMYGWMTLHLKGEGDGSPIKEPEIKTEDPEALRCYPGTTRPDDWVTIPKFAASAGRKLLAAKAEPKTAEEWKAASETLRGALVGKVLGGEPRQVRTEPTVSKIGGTGARFIEFQPETGLNLVAGVARIRADAPLAVFLDLEGKDVHPSVKYAAEAAKEGWSVATVELRATGTRSVRGDKIGRAPDHNSAEWGLWIGRPLLGQWVVDVRRLLDTLAKLDGTLPADVIVIGDGPAGLVALAAAATDKRITRVAAVGTLASYVSDEPYVGQRLGVMAPGIVREVGDVAHLAALAAPRRVVIAGGVTGGGKPLTAEELRAAYNPAARVWELLGAGRDLILQEKADPAEVVRALR